MHFLKKYTSNSKQSSLSESEKLALSAEKLDLSYQNQLIQQRIEQYPWYSNYLGLCREHLTFIDNSLSSLIEHVYHITVTDDFITISSYKPFELQFFTNHDFKIIQISEKQVVFQKLSQT